MYSKRVDFEKGYNYLHETGPNRRGQHGMQIRFLLIGELGAVQFLMFTHWTPLGIVDEGRTHHEPCHIDRDGLRIGYGGFVHGMVMAPSGADFGYHWLSPIWESQEGRANCPYLDGRECYNDGSGLQADDVLVKFISEGEDALWDIMTKRYEELAAGQ